MKHDVSKILKLSKQKGFTLIFYFEVIVDKTDIEHMIKDVRTNGTK